jgi:serine/threonine protein kinase
MTPDDRTHTTPPDATRDQSPSDAALDAGLAAAFGGDTTRDSRPLGAAGEVIGGRYHLIDEVGTGGMGSVWRAEQRTPVKRYVAVKLVKAGMDSKAVLARFDAERQALAVMDHPNIARVFDGGVTADGRPYFVMELVKGTPITVFADARKLTPRQRLELFVPVCSAIQHAHMKGVIHRDIKPSNVLVALYDDKAVPKVIDFGVAKATGASLTDHTLHTGLGAVVGTPEYMSPEQASLNNLDIDTRSDVYALGVLLYELLTGSPPFTRTELEKAGLLELLRVVREVEPPRPSVRLSTAAAKPSIAANRGTEPTPLTKLLRSELDWVVMKALEKDRNRRYDSANGFAADVQRYLAGEAVQAVPPSLGYRMRKWVRKNRGLVTTSGLVAASLLAGTGLATWQAIRADQEAERVRQEQAKTKDALAQSEKNREQAEINLVHSFLRPIGFNTSSFDQAELIALDELARQDDDRLVLLFLREAMSDPERSLRVARRAERVVQAAVGTNLKRREAALKLTSEKQRDSSADPRCRLAACWLAIELGSDDLPALKEGFDTLLARKVWDGSNLADHLPARIHPTQRAALADALVGVLAKTTDYSILRMASGGVATLIPRLEPATAQATLARAADALVDVFGKSIDSYTLGIAVDGLVALAPRLDPAAAERGFDALVGVLDKTTDASTLCHAADGLAALAPHLDPAARDKFIRGADALVTALGKTTDGNALGRAVDGLAAVALRLEPATAQATLARAADALVGVFTKTTHSHPVGRAADGLVLFAFRLDPATAQAKLALAADALMATLGKTTNGDALRAAADGLATLAPKLDPARAGKVADALVAALGKTTDEDALSAVADGLTALAPRLDPSAAGNGFDALLGVLARPTAYPVVRAAAEGLAALAPRLDPAARAKFAQAADVLVGVFGKTTDYSALGYAADGLAAFAPRLDPVTAGKGVDALVGVLGKTTGYYALWRVAEGLAALAPRLDPLIAQAKLTLAADALLTALTTSTDSSTLQGAARGVLALAPRLDPAKLTQAADALVGVLSKSADGNTLERAAEGLTALAPRLDPVTAGNAFDALTGVFGKTTDYSASQAAAGGLAALASRLNPAAQAKFAQAAEILVGVLGKTTDGNTIQGAAQGLAALAPRLDPATAGKAFDALVGVLGKAGGYTWDRVTGGLTALAPRLDPATAGKAFDTLEAAQARLLDEMGNDVICRSVLDLLPRVAPGERAERLHRVLRRIMTYDRQWGTVLTYLEDGEGGRLGPSAFLLTADRIESVPFLAELLRDPGCYGEFKDAVLLRLERFAYPDPAQAAVFAGWAADPLRAVTLPALQKAHDDHRQQTRRFRTVSDAAKWLAEHHPDIDLDKPYHKHQPSK